MFGASSSVAEWFTLLEPAKVEPPALRRPDDPRLGEIIERWNGDRKAVQPLRAVIVGFPQDEGVRRNGGRVGAAKAPDEIRRFLHRLTATHAQDKIDLAASPPLDAGNIRINGTLEESQEALGTVVAEILKSGATPIVLGGGHETAYGHYLGYVKAGMPVGIINIDAHLDIRPCIDGLGHSGSPFRQAMEHPTCPLPGSCYTCIGAQPFAISAEHLRFLENHGGKVVWASEVRGKLATAYAEARRNHRLVSKNCRTLLTIDADAFAAADVPGVSAPNAAGLAGLEAIHLAHVPGDSLELVEINPEFDVDHRSVRWAAVVIWHFLAKLAQ